MDFNSLLQDGAGHAWLYLPVAVALGALHGLEPGHSKTMMAAFIIAVRGTVVQAALLGLSAAISHSLVIWILAALALKFGGQWNVETTEPYFLIGTGVIVIAMAAWTLRRLRAGAGGHHHAHDESRELAHPDGALTLSIFEEDVPPQFRVAASTSLAPVALKTFRVGGAGESYTFERRGDHWESNETIPEPHEFRVEMIVRGPSGEKTLTAEFAEQVHEEDDAHARGHAEEIRRKFTGREVTTGQIVLFGLTGGLMPCPAAFTILLLCLQLKRFTLGFTMVAGFSAGLALTLVSVGVAAAWGMKQIAARTEGLSRWAHRAPYFSSGLLMVLGAVFVVRGFVQL